jgi:hypothetical protein
MYSDCHEVSSFQQLEFIFAPLVLSCGSSISDVTNRHVHLCVIFVLNHYAVVIDKIFRPYQTGIFGLAGGVVMILVMIVMIVMILVIV